QPTGVSSDALPDEGGRAQSCGASGVGGVRRRTWRSPCDSRGALDAREVPETLLAPGFRMENIVTAISDKTYHGAPGIREWFGDSFDGVEGARFQLEHVIADGDDFVVGRTAISGVGARSGAPLYLAWISV